MIEIAYRLKHRAAYHSVGWLSTRPSLYYGVRYALGKADELCVSRSTALVIEGFPRSANSTTVSGFLKLQKRPISVAHHKHHAAQILRALRWNIPAVVLIRDPLDAILSFLAMVEEERVRTGRMGPGNALTFADVATAWLRFYRAILPVKNEVIVTRFEDVTRNLSGMITAINGRWGTSFVTGSPTNPHQLGLGRHALPTVFRDSMKSELSDSLRNEERRGRLDDLLGRCAEAHHALIDAP